jgi:hypothetical protein
MHYPFDFLGHEELRCGLWDARSGYRGDGIVIGESELDGAVERAAEKVVAVLDRVRLPQWGLALLEPKPELVEPRSAVERGELGYGNLPDCTEVGSVVTPLVRQGVGSPPPLT